MSLPIIKQGQLSQKAKEARFQYSLAEPFLKQPDVDPKILAIQQPSTKRDLLRPVSQDEEWRNRPIPESALFSLDKLMAMTEKEKLAHVGARDLSVEEILIEETRRRRPKNSQHQSELSSVSPEKKSKAEQAFRFTPTNPLSESELERKVQLTPITQYQGPVLNDIKTEVNISWYTKLSTWFKSAIIRQGALKEPTCLADRIKDFHGK